MNNDHQQNADLADRFRDTKEPCGSPEHLHHNIEWYLEERYIAILMGGGAKQLNTRDRLAIAECDILALVESFRDLITILKVKDKQIEDLSERVRVLEVGQSTIVNNLTHVGNHIDTLNRHSLGMGKI